MDADDLARELQQARFGHLERRQCTAESPMPFEDKDKYQWSHGDAVELRPFFNLVLYECPHCKFSFTAFPRSH